MLFSPPFRGGVACNQDGVVIQVQAPPLSPLLVKEGKKPKIQIYAQKARFFKENIEYPRW